MKLITFRRSVQDGRDRTAILRCEGVTVAPQAVLLVTVDPDDLRALGEHDWTTITWTDDLGQRQERTLRACDMQGADMRCSV